jgi:hypothetical protein
MHTPAVVGSWYQDDEQQLWFEVVALDEDEGTIDVQYSDGSINEFDLENWQQLSLSQAAAPEDSDAAYELGDEHRWQYKDALMPMYDNNPLTLLEPESFPSIEDF